MEFHFASNGSIKNINGENRKLFLYVHKTKVKINLTENQNDIENTRIIYNYHQNVCNLYQDLNAATILKPLVPNLHSTSFTHGATCC